MMYTSGTTGNPKGVLARRALCAGAQWDRLLVQLPAPGRSLLQPGRLGVGGRPARRPARDLALRNPGARVPQQGAFRSRRHASGCWRSTARRSDSIRRPRSRSLREVKNPREKYRELRLRCIVSGAEPVSPQLSNWVDEELQVEFNQAFGQTEANYFIGNCTALEKAALEPLGKAYPGHEVAVVNPQTGVRCKLGESGEIAIRSDDPVVMREYWKNPAAMAKSRQGRMVHDGRQRPHGRRGLRLFPGTHGRRHQDLGLPGRAVGDRSEDHGASSRSPRAR